MFRLNVHVGKFFAQGTYYQFFSLFHFVFHPKFLTIRAQIIYTDRSVQPIVLVAAFVAMEL
jgi:hypothetical protein